MKKKIFMILFVTIFLMGFNSSSDQSLVQSGMKLVETLSEKTVSFVEIVSEENLLYPGLYLYTDGNYEYYVNIEDNYINFINATESNQGNQMRTSYNKSLATKLAYDYFNKAYGYLIMGELNVSVNDSTGMGYIVNISEAIDGYDTGTKAVFIINEKGVIVASSFVKGDPERIKNLDKSSLLTESEAAELAIQALKNEKKVQSVDNTPFSAKLTTFKGEIFWILKFHAVPPEERSLGREEEYHISVDALTGDILSIGEEVH